MIVHEYTKDGERDRELTDEEIQAWADRGDVRAKKEIFKKDKSKATSIEQRVAAIEKFLED